MDDSNHDEADLAKFETEVLAGLKPDAEDPILDLPPTEAKPVEAAPTTTAAPAEATTTAPAAAPVDRGDPRAALRASRRAEREAREAAQRLAEENAQLREQLGQPKQIPGVDPDLQAVIDDLPAAAPMIQKLVDRVKQLEGQTAAPKQEEPPAFVPDTLPAELQSAVEKVPQLEDWQHDPDQTAWSLAKKVDGLLMEHPAWKGKPMQDRMAEVARRVSAELGTPQQPTRGNPANQLQQRLQSAPERDPETLSDLRGGVPPSTNSGPDFYSMKSDDDVMAALSRLS